MGTSTKILYYIFLISLITFVGCIFTLIWYQELIVLQIMITATLLIFISNFIMNDVL